MRNKKSKVQIFASFKSKTQSKPKEVMYDDAHLENQNNKWESPEIDFFTFIEKAQKYIQEKTNFYEAKYLKTPHGLVRM